MSGERATTIKQTFRVCNIGALTGAEIDKYYVDLDSVRSTQAINGVSNQLNFLEPGEPAAILFTGHRGCGKSTELQRIKRNLEQRLDERYEVIYVKATDELDINDADYKDIYLVIVKYLTQALESWGLQNSPQLIQAFRDWFKDIIREEEWDRETTLGIGSLAAILHRQSLREPRSPAGPGPTQRWPCAPDDKSNSHRLPEC
jgi:hypothetical protein